MAKDVSNFIRITIPRHLLNQHAGVSEAVAELTRYVGGCTRTETVGEWYDETNRLIFDSNFTMQWNFDGTKFPRAEPLSRKVVDALFAAGEKAVFKERNYNVNGKSRGYRARILYPETNPIPAEVIKRELPAVIADDTSMRHIQLNS
ncbi:hypothetical protein [Stenotrophomonas phage BUCT609]|uniref:Uncharacterized protein n=1 Tax=Stenotrophomonas phage BUCT609 TaxID=2834250 RepID=A0A8E6PLJ7_9CAUD|nr:hypothetical protein [Stenotrophomonas phage BUCT609]